MHSEESVWPSGGPYDAFAIADSSIWKAGFHWTACSVLGAGSVLWVKRRMGCDPSTSKAARAQETRTYSPRVRGVLQKKQLRVSRPWEHGGHSTLAREPGAFESPRVLLGKLTATLPPSRPQLGVFPSCVPHGFGVHSWSAQARGRRTEGKPFLARDTYQSRGRKEAGWHKGRLVDWGSDGTLLWVCPSHGSQIGYYRMACPACCAGYSGPRNLLQAAAARGKGRPWIAPSLQASQNARNLPV